VTPPVPPDSPPGQSKQIGLSASDIELEVVRLRGFGEIMGIPGPQLDTIIAKARRDLGGKP